MGENKVLSWAFGHLTSLEHIFGRTELNLFLSFFLFFVAVRPFCAPWAFLYIISGAGVVSGTLHPAVGDMHISSSQFAQSVDCRLIQAYKNPNSCGEGLQCLVTSSE